MAIIYKLWPHIGLFTRQQVCHLVWKLVTNALPGWTEVEAAVALSSILADWGLVGPHWSLAPDCPPTTLSRLHDWRSTKTSGGVKSVKNFCGEKQMASLFRRRDERADKFKVRWGHLRKTKGVFWMTLDMILCSKVNRVRWEYRGAWVLRTILSWANRRYELR